MIIIDINQFVTCHRVKHNNICIQDLNTLLQRPQQQKTLKKGSLDKSVFEKVLT